MVAADAAFWAEHHKIRLVGGEFTLYGHEHQVEVLQDESRIQVFKKATQIAGTEGYVLKSLHGLIHNKYPQGILYLFPTADDVTDFSASRFGPLINDNKDTIGRYVRDTNRSNLKRIGRAYLFFRGARLSQTIERTVKSATKLKSIPVDGFIADELDEMEPNAIEMAKGRYAHSQVKFEWYLANPTIPEYGIDALYNKSDQRVWMIPCPGCGKETCLELTFPDCLVRLKDGRVIRLCMHCRRRALNPREGHWVAQFPDRSKDIVGRWISHLSNIYTNPKDILNEWESPDLKKQFFYNLKLGMAWIATENQLTVNDIYERCGIEPMLGSHPGPCAMGVDVQGERKGFHVVIGYKTSHRSFHICKMARVSSLQDVDDLRRRFHVKQMVFDEEPETRLVKAYAKITPCDIYLCRYKESQRKDPAFDSVEHLVSINRTEICDTTHDLVTDKVTSVTYPRRCPELEEYAQQMTKEAKVLHEDKDTGVKSYFYKKLGTDDYYHATNYFMLAAGRVGICNVERMKKRTKDAWDDAFTDRGQAGSFMGR